MLISENQILEVLRRQNIWWQTGKIPDELVPKFKRLAFYEVHSFLTVPDLNRAIILSGARRVGKTVLLHQIGQYAIDHGTSPKKVLYVSFEDLTLTQANLREILGLYERNIEAIDGNTYILLDELHYTSDWSRWLMTILREYPKAHVIATGSAAVLLRNVETNESGVGRWTSVHVPTLSFYEYAHMRGLTSGTLAPSLTLAQLTRLDDKKRESVLSAIMPLQREFNRYLLQGGFPAAVSDTYSLPLAQRLLREDVIDKALKRDMAHLYGARSLGELDQIFVYLCFNTGGIVEKNTLAKELGVAASTVEKHLQRLEDAHLIYRLPPIKLEGKKALKPRPKVYVSDSTLRNAVLLRGESIFENETELGAIIESCIYRHLYAFYYPDRPRFGYWKDPKTSKEVDIVLQFPNGSVIACEVKYRENPSLSKKDGLNLLLETSKPPERSFLITKNNADYGPLDNGKTFQIPAYVFTYLLGHVELLGWLNGFS